MALSDAINTILKARKVNNLSIYCAYQLLYNSLTKDDQKTLDNAWQNNYPVNLIVRALRSDGKKISADSIRAHRNGTCKCPKE